MWKPTREGIRTRKEPAGGPDIQWIPPAPSMKEQERTLAVVIPFSAKMTKGEG